MAEEKSTSNNTITDDGQSNSTYEVFILVLAYLSLLGLAVFFFLSPANRRPVLVLDAVLCAIFLFDFLRSLYRAPSKQSYLKWGWLDLVGSLPGVPVLRLARIHRIIRGTKILRTMGYRGMLRSFLSRRAESALLSTLLGTLLILGLVTILVVMAERQSPAANITTAEDALWWAYVTVTTVGYGDLYPVTSTGRLLASILMLAGVGLFSVITSFLASTFLRPNKNQEDDMAQIKAELTEIKQLLQEREKSEKG